MANASNLIPIPGEPLTYFDQNSGQYLINLSWYRFFNEFLASVVTGTFNGDVSGIAPTLSVVRINGAVLGTTTASSGNVLIGDGSQWVTRALSGDLTISSVGNVTLNNGSSTRSNLGLGSIATQNSSNVTITGGSISATTIDNSSIGAITPSSAIFITAQCQFGSSSSNFNVSGVVDTNVTPASNTSTTETDLMTYTLPANALITDSDSIEIIAWGTTAANANNKTVRLKFGSTYLLQSTTAAANGVSWKFHAIVSKTGAATQTAVAEMQSSATFTNTTTVTAPTETLSSTVIVKVTGQSGTASNDITQLGMIIRSIPST
jgi:hypothetical protein